MENIYLVLTILFIHLLAVASPGPDFIVAVRNSLSFGRRAGVFTAIGFGLGICIHLLYCYFGIAILISQNPVIFSAIKIVGGIYLLYIAYQIFMHRNDLVNTENISEEVKEKKMTDKQAISSGFWTNALNPKATLFFLGLFSTAIPNNIDLKVLLVICFFLAFNTFLWFTFVAFVFTQEKSRKLFIKNAFYINIALATVLALLSLKILVS